MYVPIKHRFTLQYMRMHMLFKKTVDEDRQGSETNIIQSQVYTVIEGLKTEIKVILRFEEKSCSHLLKVKSHNIINSYEFTNRKTSYMYII